MGRVCVSLGLYLTRVAFGDQERKSMGDSSQIELIESGQSGNLAAVITAVIDGHVSQVTCIG